MIDLVIVTFNIYFHSINYLSVFFLFVYSAYTNLGYKFLARLVGLSLALISSLRQIVFKIEMFTIWEKRIANLTKVVEGLLKHI